MKQSLKRLGRIAIVTVAVALLVWITVRPNKVDPVVGAWRVEAQDAPFSHHMFIFHADHTMSQANPDAGNPNTSDSDGAGTWRRTGHTIIGKFVEVTADRNTHNPVSRGEISFSLTVSGDGFVGTADAHFYDMNGNHLRGPLPTSLEGKRVTS